LYNNLELGEWRAKKDWKTPASCMDGHQQRNLIKVIETITKMFARYSQRPGTGWPEQEWVLLQLTKINGVGDKCPDSHWRKTAVNAYGRKEGIAKYNSWCTNTKEGGDGFVNRSTSSLDKFESFWKSREEDEVDPVSTHPESSESVGGAADGG
jgi:hypothetical protein